VRVAPSHGSSCHVGGEFYVLYDGCSPSWPGTAKVTSHISFLLSWRIEEGFSFSSHYPLVLVGSTLHSYPAPVRFLSADRTSSNSVTMFDVSWVDPKRETVGQRKNRKEQSSIVSRRSSIHSSRSGSTESPSTKSKPSLLNLFGSVKTPSLDRTGSHPKLSGLRAQDATKASRRTSSYTVTSDTSSQEISGPSTTTTRFPASGFFNGPFLSDDQSTPSEGMLFTNFSGQTDEFVVSESVFSGRTGRSRKTESTWSSVESTTSGRIVHPLSPTSFVTQSTELTISPDNGVKAVEQLATVVRISSAGTIPIHIHDSPGKS
jgi:hypothetical protein